MLKPPSLRKKKPLNSKTPQWFKDWHEREFTPIKARQDILIILFTGLAAAAIVRFVIG